MITHKPFKNRYWSWRRNNWSGSVTIPRAAHHFRIQVLDSKTLNKKSDVIFLVYCKIHSRKGRSNEPVLQKQVRGTRRFSYVRIARIWKTSFFPSYFKISSLNTLFVWMPSKLGLLDIKIFLFLILKLYTVIKVKFRIKIFSTFYRIWVIKLLPDLALFLTKERFHFSIWSFFKNFWFRQNNDWLKFWNSAQVRQKIKIKFRSGSW